MLNGFKGFSMWFGHTADNPSNPHPGDFVTRGDRAADEMAAVGFISREPNIHLDVASVVRRGVALHRHEPEFSV